MSNQTPKIIDLIHNSEKEVDVVIIGAGLSGLTTAIILARAGRSVTILEQSSKVGEEQERKIPWMVFILIKAHMLFIFQEQVPRFYGN